MALNIKSKSLNYKPTQEELDLIKAARERTRLLASDNEDDVKSVKIVEEIYYFDYHANQADSNAPYIAAEKIRVKINELIDSLDDQTLADKLRSKFSYEARKTITEIAPWAITLSTLKTPYVTLILRGKSGEQACRLTGLYNLVRETFPNDLGYCYRNKIWYTNSYAKFHKNFKELTKDNTDFTNVIPVAIPNEVYNGIKRFAAELRFGTFTIDDLEYLNCLSNHYVGVTEYPLLKQNEPMRVLSINGAYIVLFD